MGSAAASVAVVTAEVPAVEREAGAAAVVWAVAMAAAARVVVRVVAATAVGW